MEIARIWHFVFDPQEAHNLDFQSFAKVLTIHAKSNEEATSRLVHMAVEKGYDPDDPYTKKRATTGSRFWNNQQDPCSRS